MDYLQKVNELFIWGFFWLLKRHFVGLCLVWGKSKMWDDTMQEKNCILLITMVTLRAASSILLHCQVVSLTPLQAICADYSRNEDAYLPLFHLKTKQIVFCCWIGHEKSIEKCLEHFTAVKSGNCYRSFCPLHFTLWETGVTALFQPSAEDIKQGQQHFCAPFQQKCSQLWSFAAG